RQQTCHGLLPVFASIAEHDLAPLDRGPEGTFGDVVRGLGALLVDEGKKVLIVKEQRPSEIAHFVVDGINRCIRCYCASATSADGRSRRARGCTRTIRTRADSPRPSRNRTAASSTPSWILLLRSRASQ